MEAKPRLLVLPLPLFDEGMLISLYKNIENPIEHMLLLSQAIFFYVLGSLISAIQRISGKIFDETQFSS
jgi:hypothetical protein